MNLTAAQTRAAQTLLGWTSATLAERALLAFDDVAKAVDGVEKPRWPPTRGRPRSARNRWSGVPERRPSRCEAAGRATARHGRNGPSRVTRQERR